MKNSKKIVKQFIREYNSFLISEVLSNEENEDLLKEYQKFLYIQLPFTELEWNSENPSDEIKRYKQKLKYLENFVHEKASEESNIEFDSCKQNNNFETFEQLENEISKTLNKKFTFGIFFDQFECEPKKTQEKILEFYNFLINSKIISKQNLLQSVYHLGLFGKNENFPENWIKVVASTISRYYEDKDLSTAIICVDFHKEWENEQFAFELYQQGQWSTADYFKTFPHEFWHVICFYYTFSPNLRTLVNLNIQDKEEGGALEEDIFLENGAKKVIYHFFKIGKLDLEKNISINDITNSCQKELVKKIYANDDSAINDYVLNMLASWTLVPTLYARKDSRNNKKEKSLFLEWFAEGFAYWYITPKNERNKIWEFWHEYFFHLFRR